MYVYVCVCLCLCVCVYVCLCLYLCVCVCVCVCVYVDNVLVFFVLWCLLMLGIYLFFGESGHFFWFLQWWGGGCLNVLK